MSGSQGVSNMDVDDESSESFEIIPDDAIYLTGMTLSETSVALTNTFQNPPVDSNSGSSGVVNNVIASLTNPSNIPHSSNNYIRFPNVEDEEVELPVEFFTEHPSLLEAISEDLQGAAVNNSDGHNSMSSGGTAQSVQMSSGSILSENVNYSVPIQFPSSTQIHPIIDNEGLTMRSQEFATTTAVDLPPQ